MRLASPLQTAPAAQGGADPRVSRPTVGDTIWVARTVAAAPGVTVRAADWDAPEPIERLGAPVVTARGDSTEIAYPIVVWRAGPLTVDLPGPLLLKAGTPVDSLPPLAIPLQIASVLPAVPADSSLAPQPRADFVPRTSATLVPLFVLLAAAALLLAPLHWWWRRRGPSRARPVLPASGPVEAPLDRWADAGESRAVASIATARLRALIAARMPAAHLGLDTESVLHTVSGRHDWPLAELADVLRSLDEARFGDTTFPDAVGL
ncbi:MAG TPA: hypothetical protein VFJ50_11965, partial [Gemmatimonadales bacterium]|nr:hypothetical protein [Gemmatimonadales bacterium]